MPSYHQTIGLALMLMSRALIYHSSGTTMIPLVGQGLHHQVLFCHSIQPFFLVAFKCPKGGEVPLCTVTHKGGLVKAPSTSVSGPANNRSVRWLVGPCTHERQSQVTKTASCLRIHFFFLFLPRERRESEHAKIPPPLCRYRSVEDLNCTNQP